MPQLTYGQSDVTAFARELSTLAKDENVKILKNYFASQKFDVLPEMSFALAVDAEDWYHVVVFDAGFSDGEVLPLYVRNLACAEELFYNEQSLWSLVG